MKKKKVTSGFTLAGFEEALDLLDIRIVYDVREERFFVTFPGAEPEYVNDRSMSYLRQMLAEQVFVTVDRKLANFALSKERFYHFRDALGHKCNEDSFLTYLKSLPDFEIDHMQVAEYNILGDKMMSDVLGVVENDYTGHGSRAICLSAVWRAFEPGYKVDEVVVVKGRQHIGKDTILSSLLPRPRYHTDSFSFSMSHKEKVEATRGKVFVVASEMGGVTTTKDLEALKQYITMTHDDIRLAYRRDADLMPRRFTMLCTTNLDKPLPDDATGNRRWIVLDALESQVGAIEPFMETHRDRYWACAVKLYKMGVRPNLPREMKGLQSDLNEDLRRSDEAVADAYASAIADKMLKLEPQTLTQIAVQCGLVKDMTEFRSSPRALQHRLRNELILQGWVSRKGRIEPGANIQRLWYPDNVDK